MKLNIQILFFFVVGSNIAHTQVSGYNLSEYQLGNIPGILPKDRNTLFNQLNLQYRENNMKVKLRSELFFSSDSISNDYYRLSQFSLDYKVHKFGFTVGNLYETMGHGVLLRGYEVNSSVYEDIIYRIKQGFYRDILGIATNYQGKIFGAKFISGKVLNNLFPPGFEERRQDYITGLETSLKILKQTLGTRILRLDALGETRHFESVSLDGILPYDIFYYSEYAFQINETYNNSNTSGLYIGISKSFNDLGFSLEYKDYHNIFIGSGISDPPTLVKEHSYKLLNRSTHFTDLFDEKGYQAEIFYTLKNGSVITLNTSKAINEVFNKYIFEEFFGEYSFYIGSESLVKTFFDWSKNEFQNESKRLAGGLYYSGYLGNGFSTILDAQYQYINRSFRFSQENNIHNIFSSASLSKSNKLSFAIIYEFTNDPIVSDRVDTRKTETSRHYPGISVTYRPENRINLTFFAGSRRGGPACTSGICYEVLDFEGIELRTTIKI